MTIEEAFDAAPALRPSRRRSLRRLWLRWRARALRALRAHSMLPFTAALLVVAALVGAGVFEGDASDDRSASAPAASQPAPSPLTRASTLTSVITLYLVDSEEQRQAVQWNHWETGSRDVVGGKERLAFLARDPAEEEAARRAIDDIRIKAAGMIVRVEDLRGSMAKGAPAYEQTVIFMLVDSEEKLIAGGWEAMEDESRAVKHFVKQVPLLARTPEEEGVAWAAIQNARDGADGARIVVHDLRAR